MIINSWAFVTTNRDSRKLWCAGESQFIHSYIANSVMPPLTQSRITAPYSLSLIGSNGRLCLCSCCLHMRQLLQYWGFRVSRFWIKQTSCTPQPRSNNLKEVPWRLGMSDATTQGHIAPSCESYTVTLHRSGWSLRFNFGESQKGEAMLFPRSGCVINDYKYIVGWTGPCTMLSRDLSCVTDLFDCDTVHGTSCDGAS